MEATIRDLRLHTAEVLAAADRGERVTITSRGRVRAVLMRCEEIRARAHAERNPAFGLWADRQRQALGSGLSFAHFGLISFFDTITS